MLKYEQKITEIFPPMPLEDETFSTASLVYFDFAAKHAQYSGKVGIRMGWMSSDEAPSKTMRGAHKHNGELSSEPKMRQTLLKWYAEHKIDPMDPENTSLLHFIQSNAAGSSDKSKSNPSAETFHLNEDLTAFCSKQKLDSDKRLNLLVARFNSDLRLKNCKLIPHTEIEIEMPTDINIFEEMVWVDPIDVQRYQGKKYLKHAYDIITNHCEVINQDFECHDLLIGDTAPTLNGILEAISNAFSPRRPLNPVRKSLQTRRYGLRQAEGVNRFNIILNVVRASGIPHRIVNDQTSGLRRSNIVSSVQNCK